MSKNILRQVVIIYEFQKVVIILLFWRLVKIVKDQNKRPSKYYSKNSPKTLPYGPRIVPDPP